MVHLSIHSDEWLFDVSISSWFNMHVFRVLLLVAVIMVVSSEGFLIKKALLKKALAVKAGFLAEAKAAAVKFKAGAELKKEAILGGFKALGKAKLGIIKGIKAAKLKVLAGIAAVKLAKVAAIKAGKLAFVKTLAAIKLAPFIAKKLAATALIGKGAAVVGGAGELLKGKDDGVKKSGNFFLDGITGLFGGALPLDDGAENPLGSILGDLVLGGLGGGLAGGLGGGQKFDFGNILGGLSGLPTLLPQPGKPDINIQTYQVNPPPIYSYGPPEIISSYSPSVVPQSPSYSPPATSYGVPQY